MNESTELPAETSISLSPWERGIEVGCWLGALLLWLGLAFSLGWYYTFTYYGHAGWPMPMVDVCAAIILYYFSVLNVDTEIQAIHWMLVFPIAGALWAWAIWFLAPRFKQERPPLSHWALALSTSASPILLAGPAMALLAAKTDADFSTQRMIDVALRHGFVTPPAWLSPLFLLLGLLGLGWQIVAYQRCFKAPLFLALLHTLAAALLTVTTACVVSAAAAIPLRHWLE
jgi:hypothetical protein